eukprot:TRINITY_DN18955_c0_g1_i1.p1 TRINITY_DN18955_c0_g1~~TRINITY_DN18955_c0_g1_i1.p1  ORF type:complete len:182 (+),score=59.64 TRINITY_DN18955_c0_g1_i1:1-546(+)
MDISPAREFGSEGGTPRGSPRQARSGRKMSPGSQRKSPAKEQCYRRVTTGMEDYIQLEWLVEKLAKELSESRKREAKVKEEVTSVASMMGDLQKQVAALWRENAALQTKLSQETTSKKLASPEQTPSVPSLSYSAITELSTWFDDRAELQRIIESQQQEISKLTNAVRSLTSIVESQQNRR